jgi:putative spermidine/putrescine transport system substrate-binding protein
MKSIATIAVSVLCMSSAVAESITVASWGGSYTASQVQSQYIPFESKTGIKVTSVDYDGSIGDVVVQVKSGNVKWDVVVVDKQDALKACEEGYLETINSDKLPAATDGTPAAKDFLSGNISSCGIGNILYSNVVAYDHARLGTNAPKTLEDFFNTKKFAGKRGLRKNPMVAMEWALLADGVAVSDVYKVLGTSAGVDRAFRKLDTIKKDIVWWEAGAQPPALLATGEVVMTQAYNGRIVSANFKEKKNFAIMWDGQIQISDFFVIPKGSKNSAAANEFIRFATGTKPLAELAKDIPYSPSRKSSMSLIPDSNPNKVWLPTAKHSGRSITNDADFWIENGDNLFKQFNAWLSK